MTSEYSDSGDDIFKAESSEFGIKVEDNLEVSQKAKSPNCHSQSIYVPSTEQNTLLL